VLGAESVPTFEKNEVNYRGALVIEGWPPKIEGIDLRAAIEPIKVPDTGYPPVRPDPAPRTEPYTPPESRKVDKLYEPYLTVLESVEETVAIPSSLSDLDIGAKKWNETDEPRNEAGIYRNVDGTQGYPRTQPMSTATVPDQNYVATGASVDEEPSMHNEYGFTVKKQIPEWAYPIEDYKPDIQEALHPRPTNVPAANVSRYAKYVRTAHEYDDICSSYEGSIYDLSREANRPVPPSEGLGYTTTHPNCKCYWEPEPDYEGKTTPLSLAESEHNSHIRRLVGQRARHHKLHTTWQDGHLSERTRGTNPMRMIQESMQELRGEIPWMTDDYLDKLENLKAMTPQGRFMLIRAAAEAITDHRSEGDEYRRLLAGDELHAMARTSIGKTADINHKASQGALSFPEYITKTIVLDADYNQVLKQIEMLVHVADPELISLIENQLITEVSINGSPPRSQDVECQTDECFLVPRGVVLGEMDGIAFTWVVSAQQGITWNNMYIPHADAGVKNTAIEIL